MNSNNQQGFIAVIAICVAAVLVTFMLVVTISSTSKVNECIKAGGNPIMQGEQLKECKR